MINSTINMGEFDELVTIQPCTITTGSQGQKTYTFGEGYKVYAKMEADSVESVNDGNLEDGQSITMTCYKVRGLDTRWRVIFHDTPYEITAIDPINRISPYCIITLHSIKR